MMRLGPGLLSSGFARLGLPMNTGGVKMPARAPLPVAQPVQPLPVMQPHLNPQHLPAAAPGGGDGGGFGEFMRRMQALQMGARMGKAMQPRPY